MITLALSFAWEKKTSDANNIWSLKEILYMALTFMPMYLMNACMWYVGTDYEEYFKYFQRLGPTSGWHMDFAFEEMCKGIKYLGLPFQTVYFLSCFLGYVLLIICIRRYTKHYAEAYLLYFSFGFFYMLGFVLLRQFIAMMIVWYAYKYIEKRKFLKYVLLICCAGLFHFSAFIMLPMYFILNRKLKFSFWLVGIICVIPFNLNYSKIMYWLFKNFKPSYLNSNFLTKQFELDVPYILMLLIALLSLFVFEYKSDEKMDTQMVVEVNSFYIGIFISIFCIWLPIYKRFAMYFLLPGIAMIPNMVQKASKRTKIVFYICLVMAGVFYNSRYISWWKVIPYRTFFGK